MPNIFSSDTEDLDTSRSDESDGWPDCDDVMTELKNKSASFKLSLQNTAAESRSCLTRSLRSERW